MTALAHAPVFNVCGYSGAGKTTLILDLVARLRRQGLAAVVVKHDRHGLHLDRDGKDTQRFFAAGADVVATDDAQCFSRKRGAVALEPLLLRLQARYDVILVEGFKGVPLPRKMWLRRHARDRPTTAGGPVVLDLGHDVDRGSIAWAFVEKTVARLHGSLPTFAGVLLGGQSARMGQPKHLLRMDGRTWLARIVAAARAVSDEVVLLGQAGVPRSCAGLPRLPDVRDKTGPAAGLCAALRWNPRVHWVFLSCDSPWLRSEAIAWLKEQARPGIWAVEPRLGPGEPPQPFAGWYDFRIQPMLEAARGPSWLAQHVRTSSPVIPPELRSSWLGCNTVAELRRASRVMIRARSALRR